MAACGKPCMNPAVGGHTAGSAQTLPAHGFGWDLACWIAIDPTSTSPLMACTLALSLCWLEGKSAWEFQVWLKVWLQSPPNHCQAVGHGPLVS